MLPNEVSGGSRFAFPGDPTLNIDGNDSELVDSDIFRSGDRYFLMSSGPFTMAPGDSQEVVFAIIHVADGGWDDSYLYLKEVDKIAQAYFDSRFATPEIPPKPSVSATALDDQIILTWDNVAESYNSEDVIDRHPITSEPTNFEFEGYNIYQFDSKLGDGEFKRIATYDKINNVKKILDDIFDTEYGTYVNVVTQYGSDSGVNHKLQITVDALRNNKPLLVNREYYFAVTAYGYNEYGIPKTLESEKEIIAVRPQVPNTWSANSDTVQYGYSFNAEHTTGLSEGTARAIVVDPTALTGADYELFFDTDYYFLDDDGIWKPTEQPETTTKELKSFLCWNVRNTNTDELIIENQTIQSGFAKDNIVNGVFIPSHNAGTTAGPIAEGLQFAVDEPAYGIKQVYETDADDVILDDNVGVYPPSLGTTGYILSHRDYAGLGVGHTYDRFGLWGIDDVIIDFSEQSLTWDYAEETVHFETTTGEPLRVPFSMYRIKFPTGERVRLFTGWWELDGDNVWSLPGGDWYDFGAPSYEPMYAWQGYDAAGNEISYEPANEAQYIVDNSLLTSANTTWGGGTGEFQYPFVTATMMVMYLDGATLPFGNKIWLTTNKCNTVEDKFTFSTASLVGKTIEYKPSNIKVWPNPYFAYNPEETSADDRQIHFTHLPEDGKCVIRIFDLAGTLVRKIEHNNGTQYEVWDVRGYHSNPVASGMYIVQIETEQGNKTIKLAVIQPQS